MEISHLLVISKIPKEPELGQAKDKRHGRHWGLMYCGQTAKPSCVQGAHQAEAQQNQGFIPALHGELLTSQTAP